MKEWLTAREIAEEKLPFMPDTKRGVTLLAERERWNDHPFARPRQGRGGGMEYRYLILPATAQMAYVQKHLRIEGPQLDSDRSQADGRILNAREQLERDARLAILQAFDNFLKGLKARSRTMAAALHHFTIKYNNQSLQVEAWIRQAVPSISPRSLMRWRSRAKQDVQALAFDRGQSRAGKGFLDTANGGEVRSFVLSWIAKNPALTADAIRGYCKDHFGEELADRRGELKPLPPLRTFQHFIKQLQAQEHVVLTKITNPDKFRSTMKLSGTGTLRHITEPNALWQIDASPVDALCLDGRHSLYACIDIATRRLVITLSRTPRASAVGLLIRKAVLRWGAPQVIKTDNGSDFVANATQQLFASLGIDPDVSDAYSPEQKGHVERVIRTFQHQVAPQLPGYVGHSVAERKTIEDRRSFAARLGADEREIFEVGLTAEQLQNHIDDWLEYVYHEKPHAGLKDRTPNAVASASTSIIRRVDERALDALLMPVAGKNGMRRMTKQGIKIDRFHYLAGSILPGTDVFVRLDPIDMGKVYVFAAKDGRFLDIALCPELADVNPQAFVKAQKQIQAEIIGQREREVKADLRALKKGPSGIERTIRLAKREAAERHASSANIIPLPKREETHSTPQIAAALDAMNAADRKPAKSGSERFDESVFEKVLSDLAPPVAEENVSPIRTTITPAQRFHRCRELRARMDAANDLSPEEAFWLGSYEGSVEWKVQRALFEDFGGQAPV